MISVRKIYSIVIIFLAFYCGDAKNEQVEDNKNDFNLSSSIQLGGTVYAEDEALANFTGSIEKLSEPKPQEATGDPVFGVINADIQLENISKSYNAKSDASGNFLIDNIEKGTYTLIVSKLNSSDIKYWNKRTVTVNDTLNISNILLTKNPYLDEVVVKLDSTPTDLRNFTVGDTITIELTASDPNNLPIEFAFHRMRNCGFDTTIQNWSTTSSMTYTLEMGDAVGCVAILIGVRNDDGIDYDSAFLGDLQHSINMTIDDGLEEPVISSVDILVNGEITANRNFAAGDTVDIIVNASDPKGLPIEYVFHRMRNCGVESTVQNWSSTNSLSYTFEIADGVNCFSILIGARNNDGLDYDSAFLGDLQYSVNFNVDNGLSPPVIESLIVKQNGVETANRNFSVGDEIMITVNASDPNSLPLEYVFHLTRSCGSSNLQPWSTSNTLTYTLTFDDITSCSGILIGVRNNDGFDEDSAFLGDLQYSVNYTVTDF